MIMFFSRSFRSFKVILLSVIIFSLIGCKENKVQSLDSTKNSKPYIMKPMKMFLNYEDNDDLSLMHTEQTNLDKKYFQMARKEIKDGRKEYTILYKILNRKTKEEACEIKMFVTSSDDLPSDESFKRKLKDFQNYFKEKVRGVNPQQPRLMNINHLSKMN